MIDDVTHGERVRRFWEAFVASARPGVAAFAVVKFGDGVDLADELARQVVTGAKRLTTSLLRDFSELGETMPKPGDYRVIVDGNSAPHCVVRLLTVDVKPLRDVDERFAWDEGCGDRSLEWWRTAHTRYFKRQGAREGFEVDEDTQVVLERFQVVWPYELADRPLAQHRSNRQSTGGRRRVQRRT
jgi:uncharacterized protein YhfF